MQSVSYAKQTNQTISELVPLNLLSRLCYYLLCNVYRIVHVFNFVDQCTGLCDCDIRYSWITTVSFVVMDLAMLLATSVTDNQLETFVQPIITDVQTQTLLCGSTHAVLVLLRMHEQSLLHTIRTVGCVGCETRSNRTVGWARGRGLCNEHALWNMCIVSIQYSDDISYVTSVKHDVVRTWHVCVERRSIVAVEGKQDYDR